MPLRDHFRPPLDDISSWESLHGGWPMVIVLDLNASLPAEFVAEPRVPLGAAFEIDVSTYEKEREELRQLASPENGGAATAVWAPPEPTLLFDGDYPTPSDYEVLVYDASRRRRLVAAIEIVSPGNKDRPENRRAFVNKYEGLLLQGVYVVIVDLVTTRSANLYCELAELVGAETPSVRGPTYAVGVRGLRRKERWRLEAWQHDLALGQPLPILPLWLTEERFVSLNLERTHEETCRGLRLAQLKKANLAVPL